MWTIDLPQVQACSTINDLVCDMVQRLSRTQTQIFTAAAKNTSLSGWSKGFVTCLAALCYILLIHMYNYV